MKKQKLPEWFNGQIYDKGDVVVHPINGNEVKLNNLELSMYDFIMGSQMLIEMMGEKSSKTHTKYLKKGLEWFKNSSFDNHQLLFEL